MRRVSFFLSFLLVALTAVHLISAESVEFSRVANILAEHCLDCHAVDDPEGKLILESYDLLMKGGESGPAIVPGQNDESLLVKMIEGKIEKDGKPRFMPPGKREKLSASDIAMIKSWIDAGALAPKEKVVVAREIIVPKISPRVPPRRAINSVAYSPGNKLLAVGRNGEVEIHSAENQKLLRTLAGPTGNVNAVVFSPDGKILYAAGGDVGMQGEVKAWNVEDGKLLRTIEGHADSIYGLAISPDGKLLASGSYDQKIKLWSTETGAEIRILSGHNGCVYALAFRADGKILASASGDRTVKLWDVASGERRDTLSQPLKEQYALAFSPDGARLAAAGVDRRIRVWEISTEASETTNPLIHSKFAHEGSVLKIAFSEDGKSLVSSAEDKTVKLWEAREMKEVRALESQPDWSPALVFILGGKGVAAGRLDGSLKYYETQTGSTLAPPKPELASVEPRGIQRGVRTRVKLVGKNLDRATSVKFDRDGLAGTILKEPGPKATELWIEVASPRSLARGFRDLRVVSEEGESGNVKLYVDDHRQVSESESGSIQLIEQLPATIWGDHLVNGDTDAYKFHARAGETIVFDAAAKAIGSKADLVLSLRDQHGKVLESNNGFDRMGDPLIAYHFQEDGEYQLHVEELVVAGSPEHFYRVSIGAFPFATAVFPPAIRKNQSAEVQLIGFNLSDDLRKHTMAASEGVEAVLPLDPEKLRWRGELKLEFVPDPVATEAEPNDGPANASTLASPGIAVAQIAAGDMEDWFQFAAKEGQEWVIEVMASRRGSPMDSRIEVRDAEGKPIPRVLLQAVRDSAVTFRGIDSVTTDCRVENWEEMELNQLLYLQGEVVKLFRAPQGPDSGFQFYSANGRRRNYFDTTASAHANAEPCYIVEPHPPGTKLVPNGLPVLELTYENDDDADRKFGADSKLHFRAPRDGNYLVRVTDARGFGGERFIYSLRLRELQPDFKISVEGMNPTVAKGSGQRFVINAERIDAFEGEIKIDISGLPPGFSVSNPIVIQAGHSAAFGTINASSDAEAPAEHVTKLKATAMIGGKEVVREAGTLGKISLAEKAPLYVALEASGSLAAEITIAPGASVPAWLKIRRAGHSELVTFQVENLPHGVIVDNIGLNGVLIPKDQNEREIFLMAAKWVPETDRWCYAVSNEAGRQTSIPVLLKVRKSSGQVAKK